MMKFKNYLPALLLLLAFIVFFSDTNMLLFLKINQIGIVFPDVIWELLTTFGNKTFALVLLFLLCWKKTNVLVAAIIASIIAGIISSTLKPLFDLARPTDILMLSNYHLIGPKISGHSFPSGHTMSAFAIVGSIIYSKRWMTWGLIILAGLVGLSRIMLGVHWPIDVLIGAMLGLSCGYAAVQISLIPIVKKSRFKWPAVVVLYFLLAVKLFWKGTAYNDVQGLVTIVSILGIFLGVFLISKRVKIYKKQGGGL